MRNKIIGLINKNEIDISVFYKTFIEETNERIDIDTFHTLFITYFRGQPLIHIYNRYSLEYNINFLYNTNGTLLKAL